MLIKSKCPSCGKAHSAPDFKAGSTGRCRECGARLTVPLPNSNTAEANVQDETPAPAPPEAPAVEVASAKSRIGRRASANRRGLRSLWLGVALGVLVVALIAGGRMYLIYKQGQPLGAIVSVEQADDPDDFIVHYTWHRRPTSRVKDGCFMIAGVGQGAQPDLAGLADMVNRAEVSLSTIGTSMRMESIVSNSSGFVVGARLDWEPDTQEGATPKGYVTSIKLDGAAARISGSGVVAFQVFDFASKPTRPV